MTGDEFLGNSKSATAFVGEKSTTDCGTVVKTSWNGVVIEWDDGHNASISHNDMTKVERVPTRRI